MNSRFDRLLTAIAKNQVKIEDPKSIFYSLHNYRKICS